MWFLPFAAVVRDRCFSLPLQSGGGHIFAFGESRALAIANMVLGLNEIQIRGEIRTNVDYTTDLLHASDYKDNKIHTDWLDSRIAMGVRAERPPWYLSVVGGALYKASTSSAAMVSEYVGYLEKGQIPPKGSFVIKVKGPEGWSWDPDQVPVVVDQAGCNANEDINFRFTGHAQFTVSGRVVGSVGGESCSNKNGGPSNVNVELLSPTGDLVTSVLTSPTGSYSFTNIIPGKYKLRASRPDFNVEVRGSAEVELGFENGLVDDIFFVPGYDIRGSIVAQETLQISEELGWTDSVMLYYKGGDPILGVHIYLYSNDISRVDCALGSGNAPGQRKALCHAVSDAGNVHILKMNQSEIEAEIHTLRDGGLLMQEEAAETRLLIDGRTCLLQAWSWSIFTQKVEELKNQSVVYVGVDGTLAGLIYVEDQIQEDARHVESLHKQGVSLYMLLGTKGALLNMLHLKLEFQGKS
ncbi:unnamed protein product [Camellia sinensis]